MSISAVSSSSPFASLTSRAATTPLSQPVPAAPATPQTSTTQTSTPQAPAAGTGTSPASPAAATGSAQTAAQTSAPAAGGAPADGGGGGGGGAVDITETTKVIYNPDGTVTTITTKADGTEDKETTKPARELVASTTLVGNKAYENGSALGQSTAPAGSAVTA